MMELQVIKDLPACQYIFYACHGRTDSVPLVCYLNNPTEFGDYLSRNLSLSQRVVEGILGATVNTSKVISNA